MDNLKSSINKILLDPRYHDLLSILKGTRNGLVYGTKVRFPHALVMTMLFRSGTLREKSRSILLATRTHAKNLGLFVTLYKTAMYLLRTQRGGKEAQADSFVAGLLGGYIVFGRGDQSSVNQQIVLYVFGRVMLALAKLSVEKGVVPDPNGRTTNGTWPIFASMSWALVMYLFRWHPDTIQPSLRSSMKYLYVNSDRWDGFRNFLIHNQ